MKALPLILALTVISFCNLNGQIISNGGGFNPLKTEDCGEDFIELVWPEAPEELSDIIGYTLERSENGDNYETIDDFPIGTLSYLDTDLVNDMDYYYRLTVDFEMSDPASYDRFTGTTANAATDLTAQVNSAVEVSLSWTNNSNASVSFVVERSLFQNEGFEVVSSPRGTTFTDQTLSPSTTYFYRVGVITCTTIYSEVITVTTPGADIIYVDSEVVDDTKDGTSWPTAYANLRNALSSANDGDQIWVANRDGGYDPTNFGAIPIDPTPLVTFSINQIGLKLYGGFDGTEESIEERPFIENNDNSYTLLEGGNFVYTIVTIANNSIEIGT